MQSWFPKGHRLKSMLLKSMLGLAGMFSSHRQVAGARQDINRSRELLVIGGQKYSLGHHAHIGSLGQIESQLQFEESAITINQGNRILENGISNHEILKGAHD